MAFSCFVETEQLKQMLSYKPHTKNRSDQKKTKYKLLDSVKGALGDKWHRFKEGTKQCFDQICFFSTELGFFYAGNEFLANDNSISERTIYYRLKELEELGLVVKVYRRSKKHNGRGKPIYLFVDHPYFEYWKNFLGLEKYIDCSNDCSKENSENSSESKNEGGKNPPTYSYLLKQENNIYLGDHINGIAFQSLEEKELVWHMYQWKKAETELHGRKIDNKKAWFRKILDNFKKEMTWQQFLNEQKKYKAQQQQKKQQQQQNKYVPSFNWLEQS